ncbi:MAG TPA: S8 family serine peptidase, partial [Actinomycetes bacterium]|nr:S8 family serine peptidase [Actinomycetes bacterium]
PSDALPLLRAGRLDRRLFDLNAVLPAVHGRPALPLIVSGTSTTAGTASQVTVTHRLLAVNGYSGAVDNDQLGSFWRTLKSTGTAITKSRAKVWLDGLRHPTLDESVPQVGAPAAWAAGFDGTGVTVAVLDTGIDATHPDLITQVGGERNFVAEFEDGRDRVGHGTHVASIVAGTGAAENGRYRGVAPGATLLDGKVCFEAGCPESAILAGMQWAADSGAKVVNMSLGGGDTPEVDPIEQAVNDLTAQSDLLFVIAAGNDGADETVESPGSADAALSVGSVDKSDQLSEFSSRGPRIGADAAIKPEITAPGENITAANSKDGFLGEPGRPYTTLSGTSMATPHVAGGAAILTQQHPTWTAARRKATLMASAEPNPDIGVFAQGAGRLNVAREINQRITTTPMSVAFGRQEFPHGDDQVRNRQVTYTNGGSSAKTLTLSLTTSAPSRMFSLSAGTLTVPAHGEATVTLSADTRVHADPGFYGGQLTARAAGVRVRTPFGVEVEPLKFTVTIENIDRSGAPAESFLTVLMNLETFQEYLVFPGSNPHPRVVPGNYVAFSFIDGFDTDPPNVTELVYPVLSVDRDQTVTFDARTAGGFAVTVPNDGAQSILGVFEAQMTYPDSFFNIGIAADDLATVFSGQVGGPTTAEVMSWITATYAVPTSDGSFGASTEIYNVAAFDPDHIMHGLTKRLRNGDLATVRASHRRNATSGLKFASPEVPGAFESVGVGVVMPLPHTRTEYYTTTTPWSLEFDEIDLDTDEFLSLTFAGPTAFRPGRIYRQQWNRAVFGPTLSNTPTVRDGNVISASLSPFGDSAGRDVLSFFDTARLALYRNGQPVGEFPGLFGDFQVPSAAANYRLEASAERGAPFVLTTRVQAVWRFRSRATNEARLLPLTAIGFRPPVNGLNQTTLRHVVIPVRIWHQPGSDTPGVTRLNVAASFDDGLTWHQVPVYKVGMRWFVSVRHPASGGWVSLRASGTDARGNTFKQTVIRAYEVVLH